MNNKTVEVQRGDLIMMFRATDNALSELLAAISDGDIKEEIGYELEEAVNLLKGYLDVK